MFIEIKLIQSEVSISFSKCELARFIYAFEPV